GSALRTILTNLAKPTAQMQKAMDQYGISLTNTDGSMKSLDEVMLNLRSSLGGLTEAEQAAAAATIFGKEAMSGALAIVNASEADFNKLSNAINNSAGAANRMAEEMQDNLQGRLTALKSAIEGVALQLYDAMKPALEAMVAVVQKIVDWIAKLSPEMQTAIVVIAGLAAAVGPLLIVLGFMASGLGSILTILPALGAAFAIVTGPIGIAVAAIAALVAMLVHLYRTNEDVRANIQTVWNAIKKVIDTVMPAILYVIETVWNNIKGVISGALNVIQGLIAVFAGILTGDFKGMWEGIKQIFSGAVEFIFNFVQLMFIGKIMAIFKNFAKAGFELLKGNWANILNGVKQFGTNILNLFKGLWDSTIGTFNAFRSTGTGIFNAIRSTLTSIVQGLVNAVKSLFSGMSSAVNSTMSGLKSSIQNIWDSIVSFFRGINLRDIGRNIIQGLINGITSMASEAMRAARNLADNVSSTIKNALKISSPSKVMEGYGKFISEGLAQGIDAAKYKVSDSAVKLVGEVTMPAAARPALAGG
ncbi:MAG: phage tail tape measure protein, partial [Candidatus Wallacebacter cryptica]